MSNFSVRFVPEALRSIDSATFTGNYQELGVALLHSPCLVKLVNNSNVIVTVSLDGVNDHDICPAGSFFLYDITSNASRESGLYIPKGTQFYVKGAAGLGSVYLTVFYPGP